MRDTRDAFSKEQMRHDYKIAAMVAPLALIVVGVFVLFLFGLNHL